MLELKPLDKGWQNRVESDPKSDIFHHPAWLNLLAECYGFRPFIINLQSEDGSFRAGIPMMEISGILTRNRWISVPFSDHCLPLYQDEESLKSLLEGVVFLSAKSNISGVELRADVLAQPSFQKYSDHVLHTIDLDHEPSFLLSRVHRMHRRNLKKAEGSGVRLEQGTEQEQLQQFYDLHLQSRRRQGIPVQPSRFFDLLRREVLAHGLGFVLLAYKDNECIAGAVFLTWQGTLTYKYGASNAIGRSLRANNLIMWTAIRWGSENGYKMLDMGKTGVGNTGLRKFKVRWGAEESPLVYSFLPEGRKLAKHGSLVRIMNSVIRNSPTWVCRVSGEVLYRYFAP